MVVKSNRCSEFRVTKRPITNNQLIRHFRIEKGTGTPHFFGGDRYWGRADQLLANFFLLSQRSLRNLTRPSFLLVSTVANKREGNWAELAFTKASGIVTGDALVSYWPISFPVPSSLPSSDI